MKTASEMPKEMKLNRNKSAEEFSQRAIDLYLDVYTSSRFSFKNGFSKCYELMSEREQNLLEVIKFQSEALELYASKENWSCSETWDVREVLNVPDNDKHLINGDYHLVSGMNARQALAKVEEKLKEIGVGK